MTQYGLRTAAGTWLPRDAYKRTSGVRLDTPDLWQDHSRAKELAEKYTANVVEFTVPTYVDRDGKLQPSHGKGE